MAEAKRLTEAGIERLRPSPERAEYPDSLTPGLRLIVQPNGKKSWAVRTRLHGRPIKHTLGSYPVLSLTEAREAARMVLKAVAKGDDPRAEKAAKKAAAADTVEAVVAEWLKRDQAKNRSVAEVTRIMGKDVVPAWRHRPLSSITKRDCLTLLDAVADRGAETLARRLHAHLARMCRWAEGRGIVATSPMMGVPKPGTDVRRDRVLDDDELASVWRAAGTLGYPFGPIVQLLALTGARRDEIAALTWGEVNETDAVIRLAGERTKNGDPHDVALAPAALAILAGLPRIKPEKGAPAYVFTTTGRSSPAGWSRAKDRLDAAILAARRKVDPEAVPPPPWRLHDLRRTVASGMARLGVNLPVIEKVLNHTSGTFGGIVGVYQRHSFADEKRDALEKWARHVAALVEGPQAAQVVPLRPRKRGR